MKDTQKILKKVADLESMAYAMIHECQQTRRLLEEDVSTSTDEGQKSQIAIDARKNLRSMLIRK